MRVHHLNAGTMSPVSARLVNGRGGLFERARLACHVLLLETAKGLILVDTGIGTHDIAQRERLPPGWLRNAAPRLDLSETAIEQVKALGFSPPEVRHIVMTHLDRDHAGGLADFPWATVHVHRREYQAAVAHELAAKPGRYSEYQWEHSPKWMLHGEENEDWFGFKGDRVFADGEPGILLIPLRGHTVGHCGVATRSDDGWLLHAGDSYYFRGQVMSPPVRTPLALEFFKRKADSDRPQRIESELRVRDLKRKHPEVTVFCTHDPEEFDRLHRQVG